MNLTLIIFYIYVYFHCILFMLILKLKLERAHLGRSCMFDCVNGGALCAEEIWPISVNVCCCVGAVFIAYNNLSRVAQVTHCDGSQLFIIMQLLWFSDKNKQENSHFTLSTLFSAEQLNMFALVFIYFNNVSRTF